MDFPKLLQNQQEIDVRITELATELDDYLSEGDVVVGVLKGCLPFLADLVRKLNHEIETDFLALTSFDQVIDFSSFVIVTCFGSCYLPGSKK